MKTIASYKILKVPLFLVCSLFYCAAWTGTGTETTTFGYTYQLSDGNRYTEGAGSLPDVQAIDLALDGVPMWLVSAQDGHGVIWVLVLEGGKTQAFRSAGNRVAPFDVTPRNVQDDIPPLLMLQNGRAELLRSSINKSATNAPVAMLPLSGSIVASRRDGALSIRNENGTEGLLEIDALPDAAILFDETERLLILSGRTREYKHGILGDTVEARGVTLISTFPEVSWQRIVELRRGSVIEGTAPIWGDLDGDGEREIILTISDRKAGSRFAVFRNDGSPVASGPSVGTGFRWRHQIAVAAFGPAGEIELAGVRTPHIGGVVEFFRLEGNSLKRTAHLSGYSSHRIGSRNLDMAVAGDFDGDGSVELIVPNQSFTSLAAIRRIHTGAEAVWELSLPGRLTTNLSASVSADGGLVLGAGTDAHTLRLWLQH
jgi:hypothetical protein